MGQQNKWWEFLSPITHYGLTQWFRGVIPSGVYEGGVLSIDTTNNLLILDPIKYILPTGKVVQEESSLSLSLPVVSLGTESNFTLIAYNTLPSTPGFSAVHYLVIEGVITDEALLDIDPQSLGLSTGSYEYLVLHNVRFDGTDWSSTSANVSRIDAKNAVSHLTVPFCHQLIQTTGSFNLSIHPQYGPVYSNTGYTEIIVGISGVIKTATIRVIGNSSGSLRVTLLPSAGYNYVQTFPIPDRSLYNLRVDPVFAGSTQTLANSAINLRLSGTIDLVDIVTN